MFSAFFLWPFILRSLFPAFAVLSHLSIHPLVSLMDLPYLVFPHVCMCVFDLLWSRLPLQIPHVKIGPEETPRLPYLRFASVTLYPSNEDLSLAIGAILRSFSYPSASLVCAKAECE